MQDKLHFSRSNARVALVLDSPPRDLRGIALVGYELLKKIAQVIIVPMYQQGYDVPLLAPDSVLVNYARNNNKDLLESYRALGIQICILDTEGGVLSESGLDSPTKWAASFRRAGFPACVDRYFFWGEMVRAAFVSDSGLPSGQLQTTGCPRYDLCAPVWRSMLEYPRSGYVLVNTNFSAINPAFTRSAETEVRIFEDTGWGSSYTKVLFDGLRAVFPQYLDTIEWLARTHPGRDFLVRPHPFEECSFYEKRFAAVKNIRVDGAGDVLNVIANADCVVHLNCGTAVETLLLGKIPISMEFLNTEVLRRHAPLPSRISCAAASRENLSSLIGDAQAHQRWHEPARLVAEEIRPWFHEIDGKAAARVADGILGALSTRLGTRRSIEYSLKGSRHRPSLRQRALGVVCNLVGSKVTAALRNVGSPARRAKAVRADTVALLLHRYAACEGATTRFRVCQARHPLTRVPLASLELRRE